MPLTRNAHLEVCPQQRFKELPMIRRFHMQPFVNDCLPSKPCWFVEEPNCQSKPSLAGAACPLTPKESRLRPDEEQHSDSPRGHFRVRNRGTSLLLLARRTLQSFQPVNECVLGPLLVELK